MARQIRAHFSIPMALTASATELLEQRQVGWQQRLTDVKARMMFFFDDCDSYPAAPARPRQSTRLAAADDEHRTHL
jgi:hypothetical protein